MESTRSLYVEMLEELGSLGFNNDQDKDLIRRARIVLEHVDKTKQAWPVELPSQPSLDDWRVVAANREATVEYLVESGIIDKHGHLTPAYSQDG